MSAWTKEIVGRGGHVVLGAMIRWLENKPPEVIHAKGAQYGRLVGRVMRKRRSMVDENLRRVFPSLSQAERQLLNVRVFEHFGRATADFLASRKRTLEEMMDSMDVTGVNQSFDQALAKGKGVIFASGHIGNWERIPSYLSMAGYPVTVVTRDADSEGVKVLVNQLREAPGTTLLPRGNATRPMLQKLKNNEIIGILADQNADDVFIDFFGYPAGTAKGLGVIAERTGATILPITCVHTSDCRYRLSVDEALVPLGKNDVHGEATMRSFNSWLEGVIRNYPEQWLWLHDRWRSAKERGLA